MNKIMDNAFFKLITCLPVTLIVLYFYPFIGVLLILLRCYVYRNLGNFNTATNLLSVGLIVLIPKFMGIAIKKFNLPKVAILNKLLDHQIYINIASYGTFLIILSLVAFVIPFIVNIVLSKIKEDKANKEKMQQIAQQPQVEEIKEEPQEQTAGTYVVHCPQCGTNTIFTTKSGTCPSCGTHIEYTE